MITNRIDAITALKPERLKEIVPIPRSVKIELTAKCNLKCGFCAHRLRSKEHGEMSQDLFMRLVDEFVHAGVEELGMFYIGESMICSWLPDAIEYAKARGIKYVFLTSNGVMASLAKVRACMMAGLDSLKWSFNHANGEQFAKMTGVPEHGFERVIKNIRLAWHIRENEGYPTGLYASSIRYDKDQGMAMEPALSRIRPHIDEHYWLPLYTFGSQARERESELGLHPMPGNPGREGALRRPLPCWAVFAEGHVTWDGQLSACCFDVADTWHMGDLHKETFSNAWNSEKFQALRRAHLAQDVTGTACQACALAG